MINDILIGSSCFGPIEPGKYFLEEENAILFFFDSPSLVVTGNHFVDRDTIHSCDWLRGFLYFEKVEK